MAKQSSPSAKRASRPRDVDATKLRLLGAVDTLLARDGFGAVGVNAVAHEAEADKTLIYRYFGSFEGLLETYAEGESFWPTTAELVGDVAALRTLPAEERWRVLLGRYVHELRRRPRTLEILAWEVVARNEVTARLEAVRERRSRELFALLQGSDASEPDVAVFAALLSAGIHYLLVRARHIKLYAGVDLRSDAGWNRLVDAGARMLAAAYEPAPNAPG